MHYLRSLLHLLSLAFTLSACHQPSTPGLVTIDIDEALKNKGELRLSEIASDVEFIALNSLDVKTYIQSDSRQLFFGEKVISMVNPNPSEVLLFARNGRFMRKIGRVGKGPGEYLGALVCIVNEKKETILIADNTSKKFLMYDFTGKCLIERTFKAYPGIALTWIGGMTINRDGKYILDNEWQPYVKGRCYNLLVMDQELNLISGLHPDKIEAGTFLVSINSGRLQEFDKNLRYWSKSTDTLFSISERYDLLPVCLFKSNDKMVFDDTGTHTISGHVSVSHYLETGEKLVIEGTDNDNRFMLSCNKADGKGTKVFASGKCGLSFGDNVGIENDLFGYSPVYFSDFAAISNGKLILILYPGIIDAIDEWLKGKLTDCLKSAKVLLPDKRDELVRLIENLDENSGPILMAIKLK